ncbi:MAG: glycogen debranching enzyme family protein [Armatimonadetes bacterium]|nr:glycogen debranching enzyme family protein [Armatimonadota bacterium]MBS1728154.1 glycogen debranching enzyme family protein [Armatimonadota bacterium]
MSYTFSKENCRNFEASSSQEWLLTNGIGGFAMGTISGANTRRYHGLLVAALNPPTGRTMIFAACDAFAVSGKKKIPLSSNQYPGAIYPGGFQQMTSAEVDQEVRWTFAGEGMEVEKVISIEPGHNLVRLEFRNLGKKGVVIQLQPLICFRDFHANFSERDDFPTQVEYHAEETVIDEGGHTIVLQHKDALRRPVHGWYYRFEHEREVDRGLDPRDDLYCPCDLEFQVAPGASCFLTAYVDTTDAVDFGPRTGDAATLIQKLEEAAEKFLVQTKTRSSILAGYPWFSDWGRDTMISIPGVCLATGKADIARQILRDYASQMEHGLIPNRFVERGEKADYNTVDATLWFANCVYLTLDQAWDKGFAEEMYAKIQESIRYHRHGTLFGIHVDPADGLLAQGEPGVQLTWMDAKIGDWVVTPRHGKPVEINGLWINMLHVAAWLAEKLGDDTSQFLTLAKLAKKNFEEKFWHDGVKYYLDTVEPNDASLRPNQVIAMSLPFTPCDPKHIKTALKAVERELLTPVGLRTLSPEDPSYHGKFKGPMRQLDEAYHQGTVWPWLFGPYIRAFVKAGGSAAAAKKRLANVTHMLTEYGIGGIAECYDGDAPHAPGGCPWQAWSVAEILWVLKNVAR